MSWRIARDEDAPQLRDFLLKREWECVSFTSRTREIADRRIPGRRGIRICLYESGHSPGENAQEALRGGPRRGNSPRLRNQSRLLPAGKELRHSRTTAILAAVLQTSDGFFYPVLSFGRSRSAATAGADGAAEIPEAAELARVLRLDSARLHSAMGVFDDVVKLERLFPRPVSEHIRYYLMAQRGAVNHDRSRLPPGLRFRRATVADADALYPLQRDYEKEEVLLAADRFDPESCYSHLRDTLRRQIVYLAENGNEAVAKAGTNARGIAFDQIGGVFTRKDLRGRGVGAALMARLLEDLNGTGRSTTLFVKQHNAAAIALYRNLGYEILEDFRISYF